MVGDAADDPSKVKRRSLLDERAEMLATGSSVSLSKEEEGAREIAAKVAAYGVAEKRPVAKTPQKPHAPWTAKASSGSSILSLRTRHEAAW